MNQPDEQTPEADTEAEARAMARALFAPDPDLAVLTVAPEPAAHPAVVPTEGGNPPLPTRTAEEQQARQFMADLLGRPDADNLPDYS